MEQVFLYFRPTVATLPYEAVCGEADAAGQTPIDALKALHEILLKTPEADAVHAAAIDDKAGPVPINVTKPGSPAGKGDGEESEPASASAAPSTSKAKSKSK